MKNSVKNLLNNKSKTVPVLSFPSTQLLGVSVNDLIASSDMQAKGMVAIKDRCPVGASLNMMDLSVEAEAFGATIFFSEDDVPTVTKGIIDDIMDAENIVVPELSTRAKICIEGIKKAASTAMRTGLIISGLKLAAVLIFPVFIGKIYIVKTNCFHIASSQNNLTTSL